MSMENENCNKNEDHLRREIVKRTSDLFVGALSLVAALAWNDAVQSLFRAFFQEASSLYAKFLYAILITAVIVFVTHRLARIRQTFGKWLE